MRSIRMQRSCAALSARPVVTEICGKIIHPFEHPGRAGPFPLMDQCLMETGDLGRIESGQCHKWFGKDGV